MVSVIEGGLIGEGLGSDASSWVVGIVGCLGACLVASGKGCDLVGWGVGGVNGLGALVMGLLIGVVLLVGEVACGVIGIFCMGEGFSLGVEDFFLEGIS